MHPLSDAFTDRVGQDFWTEAIFVVYTSHIVETITPTFYTTGSVNISVAR